MVLPMAPAALKTLNRYVSWMLFAGFPNWRVELMITRTGVAPISSFTPLSGETAIGADALRVVPSAAAPSPAPPFQLGEGGFFEAFEHAIPTAIAITAQYIQNFRVMNTSLPTKNEVALKKGR